MIPFFLFFFVASIAWAAELPAKKWRQSMNSQMQIDLCQADQYFRKCFEMSEAQCKSEVSIATATCMSRMRMPAKIRTEADGIDISYKVGLCTGQTIEKKFKREKKSDDRCSRADSWVL